MGILETIVSVALFVLIAAAQEVQDQRCRGCLPIDAEHPCSDPKKYPVKILKKQEGKACGCPAWTCIWRDCSEFNFHQDHPINCKEQDCGTEPKVELDCGCKKWVCQPRNCSHVKKIETCEDPCHKVVEEIKCNCPKYTCEIPEPPVDEQNCKKDPSICTDCQTCMKVPIVSPECTAKHPHSVHHVCGPKKCETPMPPCTDPCSELTTKKDECGCDVVECKKKNATRVEDGNGGWERIKVDCSPFEKEKECKALLGECGKCEFMKLECETGEGIDRYLWERKCRQRAKPYQAEIPKCDKDGKCMVPVSVRDKNPKCANHYQCQHKLRQFPQTEDPPKIVCEDKCKEAVLKETEWHEDPWCGAKYWKCELQAEQSPDHRPSETCDETCDDACEKCVWEFDKECKRWKAKCRSKCTKHKQTLPATCYEPVEEDECGCPEEPLPKPCTQLPEGECPPGYGAFPFKDACGCHHPTGCRKCDESWKDAVARCHECEEPSELLIVDGCPKQWCNRKNCSIPPPKKCASCQIAVMESEPVCDCPIFRCEEPEECPEPKECPEGEVQVGTTTDECNCVNPVCKPGGPSPQPPKPTKGVICGPDEDCKEFKCPVGEVCSECEPKSFFRYFF